MRRAGVQDSVAPPLRRMRNSGGAARQAAAEVDRAMQTERARFATSLDLELRLACRNEATARREVGCAVRDLVQRRSYHRLGFVRLSDYARERLGVSARTLQCAAWLATRLDALPAVSRAYDRSELSWAQARAICRVAGARDEERWLELARRSTVEALERLVARARHPEGLPPDPDDDGNEIDGEPAVRWRFACPARVRALWRHALELASRTAGEPLAAWRAAEIIAAEGSSGRPAGTSLGDRALIAAIRLARRARRKKKNEDAADAVDGSAAPGSTTLADRPVAAHHASAAPSASTDTSFAGTSSDTPASSDAKAVFTATQPDPSLSTSAPSDPFALDARLVETMRVLRTIEPRIGRLLRVVVDHRLYRSFGFASFEAYVRERLGLSARKAWALLKIERAILRSSDFARAYRDGGLSWVRALVLLPVLDRNNAPAWIARAESVTVRRLGDEGDWVLASRDAVGPTASLAPPPIDSRLASPLSGRLSVPFFAGSPAQAAQCHDLSLDTRLQIRAHDGERTASEVCDAEVRFIGPVSVVALLRDVLDAFADSSEPRWTALERVLRHVIHHWESTPRHPDPVFARDGWRCTVPACSSRRNLHDHHIRFRSRGGDNQRDNRTTVCAAHHLHGLHDGTIHASGTAPHAIAWQLGVRRDAAPLLAYVGDRRCET